MPAGAKACVLPREPLKKHRMRMLARSLEGFTAVPMRFKAIKGERKAVQPLVAPMMVRGACTALSIDWIQGEPLTKREEGNLCLLSYRAVEPPAISILPWRLPKPFKSEGAR